MQKKAKTFCMLFTIFQIFFYFLENTGYKSPEKFYSKGKILFCC